MAEERRNPNPFVRMAQQAKKQKQDSMHPHDDKPVMDIKTPKPTKGFGGKVIRKTGRGG